MKKRTILLVTVLLAAVLVLAGYCVWDGIRTDDTAPQISAPEAVPELSVYASAEELLAGVTATDDVDGDVTDSLIVESVGGIDDTDTAIVTCVAFDSAGNVSKLERRVHFVDYVSPRLTSSRALAFPVGDSLGIMSCIGAQDVLDGDISRQVRVALVSDTDSLSYEGLHQVQFQVTNSLGDLVTLVLPVEVYEAGSYNGSVALDEYITYVSVGGSFDAEDHLASFKYGKTTVSLNGGAHAGVDVKIQGQVDTDTPGVYAVSYTVSCQGYTGYAKLIVIVED